MLEFVMTALPLIFVLFSVVWMGVGMWEYHTLNEAVNATARNAAVHGAGCAGQTCATTVDTVARQLAAKASGIPPGLLTVTLTSSASTVSCSPLSNCYGNSAAWPSLSGNTAGNTNISVAATFQFASAISVWTPGHTGQSSSGVTLGANSMQAVVF